MNVHEVVARRLIGKKRRARAKYLRRRKQRKGRRMKHLILTPAQRRAARMRGKRMKMTGMARKIRRFRETAELQEQLDGYTTHHPDFIRLVLEAAKTLKEDPEAHPNDPREFVAMFLDREPTYSRTPAGVAAIQFETAVLSEDSAWAKAFVETVVGPKDDTFLAIFSRSFSEADFGQLELALEESIELELLVNVGDHDIELGTSDVAIIEGKPMRTKTADKPRKTVRDMELPESLTATEFAYLFPDVDGSGSVVEAGGLQWRRADEGWQRVESSNESIAPVAVMNEYGEVEYRDAVDLVDESLQDVIVMAYSALAGGIDYVSHGYRKLVDELEAAGGSERGSYHRWLKRKTPAQQKQFAAQIEKALSEVIRNRRVEKEPGYHGVTLNQALDAVKSYRAGRPVKGFAGHMKRRVRSEGVDVEFLDEEADYDRASAMKLRRFGLYRFKPDGSGRILMRRGGMDQLNKFAEGRGLEWVKEPGSLMGGFYRKGRQVYVIDALPAVRTDEGVKGFPRKESADESVNEVEATVKTKRRSLSAVIDAAQAVGAKWHDVSDDGTKHRMTFPSREIMQAFVSRMGESDDTLDVIETVAAPNLRTGTAKEQCGTCVHYKSGICTLYGFTVDNHKVCDSWSGGFGESGDSESADESQMVKHYFDFTKMKGGVAKSTGEYTDDARKVTNHPTIVAISQKLREIHGQLEREPDRKKRVEMVRKHVGKLSRYMKDDVDLDDADIGEAQSSSAPEYREGEGAQRCGNCAYYTGGTCTLYAFTCEPTKVCNDWAGGPKEDVDESVFQGYPRDQKFIAQAYQGKTKVGKPVEVVGKRGWVKAYRDIMKRQPRIDTVMLTTPEGKFVDGAIRPSESVDAVDDPWGRLKSTYDVSDGWALSCADDGSTIVVLPEGELNIPVDYDYASEAVQELQESGEVEAIVPLLRSWAVEDEPVVREEGDVLTAEEVSESLREQLDEAERSAVGNAEPLEPLKKRFDRWLKQGDAFTATGPVNVRETLVRSSYRLQWGMGGPVFVRTQPKTDELYRYESSVIESALSEIDSFWDLKEKYHSTGLRHTRGILLEGPPGTGKSSAIQQIAELIVERGDVVFFSDDVRLLKSALETFREVEESRTVVVVLEDLDEYIGRTERELLQLLDGDNAQDGVLYIGTTNYVERFPKRLLRSGRFDKKIHVGPPDESAREVYFRHKLKDVDDKTIKKLVADSEGMNFGDLKELVVATYILNEPRESVVRRIRAHGIQESEDLDSAVQPPKTGQFRGFEPLHIVKVRFESEKAASNAACLFGPGRCRVDQDNVLHVMTFRETAEEAKQDVLNALRDRGYEITESSVLSESAVDAPVMESAVAKTTLAQLGGRRFSLMTGAKNYVSDGKTLQFDLPRAKSGINRIRITLNPKDLYDIEYGRMTRKAGVPEYKKLGVEKDVYVEDLHKAFNSITGLRTRI